MRKVEAGQNVLAQCCIQPLTGWKQRHQSDTRTEERAMKSVLWWVGGFCAAAAGFLVLGAKRTPTVDDLAESLEEAWADHHTVV